MPKQTQPFLRCTASSNVFLSSIPNDTFLPFEVEFEVHDGLFFINISIPNDYITVVVIDKRVTRGLNQQNTVYVLGVLDGSGGYHGSHGARLFIHQEEFVGAKHFRIRGDQRTSSLKDTFNSVFREALISSSWVVNDSTRCRSLAESGEVGGNKFVIDLVP